MSSLADFQGHKEEVKHNEPDDCDDEQSFIDTTTPLKMPTRRQKKAEGE